MCLPVDEKAGSKYLLGFEKVDSTVFLENLTDSKVSEISKLLLQTTLLTSCELEDPKTPPSLSSSWEGPWEDDGSSVFDSGLLEDFKEKKVEQSSSNFETKEDGKSKPQIILEAPKK